MDDAKRDPPPAGPPPEPQRKRPQPPVLDLKATEVPKPASEKEAERGSPEADRPSSAAKPATETFSPGAVPPRTSAPSAKPDAPSSVAPPAPRRWPLAAAAALIGAVTGVLATLATAWMLGALGGSSDGAARMAELERTVRELAARPALSPEAVRAVGNATTASEQARQAVSEMQAALARTQAALTELQARPAPSPAPPDQAVGALDTATKALSEEVAALRKRLDDTAKEAHTARDTAMRSEGSSSTAAATAAGEIGALTQRIHAIEAAAKALQDKVTAASGPDRDRAARFAAAALALRVAVERSEPYAAELAALKALAAEPARLAPLEAASGEGVATAAALSRELSRLLVSMRQAADATTGNGLFDRIQAGAERLVTIRRAGEPAAAQGEALAAIESKAARGDMPGALAEVEKLPPQQRAPLDPWVRKARARADALEVSRTLAREATTALGDGAATARP